MMQYKGHRVSLGVVVVSCFQTCRDKISSLSYHLHSSGYYNHSYFSTVTYKLRIYSSSQAKDQVKWQILKWQRFFFYFIVQWCKFFYVSRRFINWQCLAAPPGAEPSDSTNVAVTGENTALKMSLLLFISQQHSQKSSKNTCELPPLHANLIRECVVYFLVREFEQQPTVTCNIFRPGSALHSTVEGDKW